MMRRRQKIGTSKRSRSTTSSLVGGEALETRRLLAFDPSPIEQAFMEDINRMRLDPQGELSILLSSTNPLRARDPAVQAALDFFNVSGTLLAQQWAELEPTHPVAWNEDLIDAALKHTIEMRNADSQSHQLPGEPDLGQRVRNEGYSPLRRATENIYAFAESHIHGHAGFVIDWGEGPGGIQSPAGHRINYMDDAVDEVGISVIAENSSTTDVGPLLTTQNFGRRGGYVAQILGVVYDDNNSNGIYDPGEGFNNMDITVTGTGGTFTTQTLTAGGYQLEVPAGNYEVRVEGSPLAGQLVVGNVTMGDRNVKVDFEVNSSNQPPLARNDVATTTEDNAVTINVVSNDTSANGSILNNTITLVSGPNNGSAEVLSNGRIIYTPNPNYSGTDQLRYTVRDTNSITSNAATVTITVGSVPDTPMASDLSREVAEDTNGHSINLTSYVTDPDDNINWNTLEIITQPINGSVQVNSATRSLIYTPDADYVGTDRLDYRVTDFDGRVSNVARVSITVTNVNDSPLLTGQTQVVVGGTPGVFNVMAGASDVDSNLANGFVQLLFGGVNGLSTIVGQSIRYAPSPNFVGRETLRYRIGDGDGAFSDPVDLVVYSTALTRAWQNPVMPTDANGDGATSPIDALTVINLLGETLTFPETHPALVDGPLPFVDIDGDNSVSPIDALLVINQLTANSLTGSTPPSAFSSEFTSSVAEPMASTLDPTQILPPSSTAPSPNAYAHIDSVFEDNDS